MPALRARIEYESFAGVALGVGISLDRTAPTIDPRCVSVSLPASRCGAGVAERQSAERSGVGERASAGIEERSPLGGLIYI